jgi:AcrR family transcriptional regulator
MSQEAHFMDKQKFLSLEPNKRDRIINAAMKEFRYGYKKASTDIIVREAGISKGLLFHYFGTKEQLYAFLAQYAIDLLQKDYFDMIDLGQKDILEGFWQIALLKRDITDQYPPFYDFLSGLYAHKSDFPNMEILQTYEKNQQALTQEIFARCDIRLLRADIDPQKTITIISWAMDGFFEAYESSRENQNYGQFLKELREYLDILRLCFYKK